jgi:hypothetical protein
MVIALETAAAFVVRARAVETLPGLSACVETALVGDCWTVVDAASLSAPVSLAVSVPALLGSVPALLGSVPALLGSVPALLGSVPALLGSAPALLGSAPALLDSAPDTGSGLASSPAAPATTWSTAFGCSERTGRSESGSI